MKIPTLLLFLPAFLTGFYLGTQSLGAKKTVKAFVDMRLPANTESEFVVNFSKEVNQEDIGSGNFFFNASLNQNETAFGLSSKSFYLEVDRDFVEVCDYLNSHEGFVTYTLSAEGVANSGETIDIEVSSNCRGFDFVELLPFEFCESSFEGFKNERIESESSSFTFINFSDFMPKEWFLNKVVFSHIGSDSGEFLEDVVYYDSSDPVAISCF